MWGYSIACGMRGLRHRLPDNTVPGALQLDRGRRRGLRLRLRLRIGVSAELALALALALALQLPLTPASPRTSPTPG